MPFPQISGDGGNLVGIYTTSGFMSIIGVLEILGGIVLWTNKFVPLALTVLMAIMFNAVVFHLLHDPANDGGGILALALWLILVDVNKSSFKDLLAA